MTTTDLDTLCHKLWQQWELEEMFPGLSKEEIVQMIKDDFTEERQVESIEPVDVVTNELL